MGGRFNRAHALELHIYSDYYLFAMGQNYRRFLRRHGWYIPFLVAIALFSFHAISSLVFAVIGLALLQAIRHQRQKLTTVVVLINDVR